MSMKRASASENTEVKWNTSKISEFRGLLQSNLNQLQSTIDGVVSGNAALMKGWILLRVCCMITLFRYLAR